MKLGMVVEARDLLADSMKEYLGSTTSPQLIHNALHATGAR